MTHAHRPGEGSSDEYATPQWLWRKLSRPLDGFDLDAASGAEPTPIAETRFTAEDDGLSQAWHGDVWLNPPFGDQSSVGGGKRGEWLTKARNEIARDEVRTVTILLPVDTSTQWWHQHVAEASVICFLDGRLNYESPDEEGGTSFASEVAVYGDPPEELVDVLEEIGAVFRGREYHRSTIQQTLESVQS